MGLITKRREEIEQSKRQAAYALNFCTVSVSQIIDYNDVYILEQEYEAILNNLNLETMPKDEALLNILKELLNTITFFRIQEDEKKLLEEEYQHNMKNAIWSAVPNLSIIVSSGSPTAMLGALAAQVGIGYMNYRKTKAENQWQHEKQARKLQQSAMEQFHALRRELFETAWRLADKYKFGDEYRLTERQITQYNQILMDADDLRRYDRLKYIQGNFEAYPPFWYYMGHAANMIYLNGTFEDEQVREKFKSDALDHFRKFEDLSRHNLLREDQIAAACALERFALTEDADEKRTLLRDAKKYSGNALDVLQQCALLYLAMGDDRSKDDEKEAVELLKMLVNEGYNQKLNAQFLSRIYAEQMKNNTDAGADYEILVGRVDNHREWLYPISENEDDEKVHSTFISQQKNALGIGYKKALEALKETYWLRFDTLYRANGDIREEMVDLLKALWAAVGNLCANSYKSERLQREFLDEIRKNINDTNSTIKSELQQPASRNVNAAKKSYDKIVGTAFENLEQTVTASTDSLKSLPSIAEEEAALLRFCTKNHITQQQQRIAHAANPVEDNLRKDIFGEKYEEVKKEKNKQENCFDVIEKYRDKLIKSEERMKPKKDRKIAFAIKGDFEWEDYQTRNKEIADDMKNAIAVLNQDESPDHDIIFTSAGVLLTGRAAKALFLKKKIIARTEYSKVTPTGKESLLIGDRNYANKRVDLAELYKLFTELATIDKETRE